MEEEEDEYTLAMRKQRKRLWADKYSSKRFLDLMSDDKSNRDALTWLKSWDDVVFNRQGGKIDIPNLFQRTSNAFFNPRQKQADLETTRQHRPVMMLYGASGVGKSTLARVIANQCGYHSKEINASDLRNGDQLVEQLRNSLSTNAYFGKGGYQATAKPVCLIIDELDGAFGGGAYQTEGMAQVATFIQKCLKANVSEPEAEHSGEEEAPKRKAKDDFPPLLRPIIFVCNDAYQKSLFPLKDISLRLRVLSCSRERI